MTVWYAGAYAPAYQTVIYTEWYKPGVALIQQFSWWWAHGCPKHVENINKYTRKKLCVMLVIYKDLKPDFTIHWHTQKIEWGLSGSDVRAHLNIVSQMFSLTTVESMLGTRWTIFLAPHPPQKGWTGWLWLSMKGLTCKKPTNNCTEKDEQVCNLFLLG